jgi:hypothetical protein
VKQTGFCKETCVSVLMTQIPVSTQQMANTIFASTIKALRVTSYAMVINTTSIAYIERILPRGPWRISAVLPTLSIALCFANVAPTPRMAARSQGQSWHDIAAVRRLFISEHATGGSWR